jgi:hypothetical protein
LSITKKAVSVGISAAMLASLVGALVAPAAALADSSITGPITVGAGGTSATAPTFIFNDNSTFTSGIAGGGFPNAGGALTYTICDSSGNATCTTGDTLSFTGTPVLTAPASLGASISVSGNSFTVTTTGRDPNNSEQFSVTGLMIKATTAAATGAIQGVISGTDAAAVTGGTTTATGTLAVAYAAGTTTILVNQTSACAFQVTGGSNGNVTVGSETATAATAVTTANSVAQITLGALSANEAAGTAVSQTVAACSGSLSPGSVTASISQDATALQVNPGQNNQPAGTTTITENTNSAGVLAVGTVVTFTLPAGVTFSYAPTALPNGFLDLGNGYNTNVACALAFTLQSCSVTVAHTTATGANLGKIVLSNISLDLAASAPAGNVNLTVSTSPAIFTVVNSATIAYTNRVIVGVGSVPNIWIGYNGQPSGLITVTESGPGFFQSGSSGNNQFQVCITDQWFPYESFTFAPYAVVNNPASGLQLLNPSTLAGSTSVVGSLDASSRCATWYIYSASTGTAASISIVGANAAGPLPVLATNGPTLSVMNNAHPGPVMMTVTTGGGVTPTFSTQVTNGMRVYKGGVVVTALSQPYIAPGTTGAAGDITIAETLNGQLTAGEEIWCGVLDSAMNENQQIYLSVANSNDLPTVTTNTSSGLIAHVVASQQYSDGFTIEVDQQAYAPSLGVITVQNIHYSVVSGTTTGPINLECYPEYLNNFIGHPSTPSQPLFGSSNGYDFDAFVSNAIVGTVPTVVMSADSSLSATGPFTTATKVLKPGQSITFRIRTNPLMAGKTLGVWIAKKGANGTWSAYAPHASVVTDVNGYAYYTYKTTSLVWLGFRFKYSDGTTTSWSYPSVFARWMK